MIWMVLVTLALILVPLVLLKHYSPETRTEVEEVTDWEITRAAIELHAIRQRFDVAWACHELRGEASRLRRELADEMRLIEALEARDRSDE